MYATKKLLPISKVFADEPVGDLGEGINLHPSIPKETALAVRLRSGDRCEGECRRPLDVGENASQALPHERPRRARRISSTSAATATRRRTRRRSGLYPTLNLPNASARAPRRNNPLARARRCVGAEPRRGPCASSPPRDFSPNQVGDAVRAG